MADNRFVRLKKIVLAASELPEADRSAYLEAACGEDRALLKDAKAHLARLGDDDSLLETGGAANVLRAGEAFADDTVAGGAFAGSDDPTESMSAGDRREPELIGPYRILGILGTGGMGIVYRAEQTAPIRREVALKLIKLGMDTREVIARFESERQALALMDHPSIAKVFDAGATKHGRPYFVMEYVRGIPITEFADRERLSIRARLSLFHTVCAAVHHAHQKGIIHRDLKPSNILVSTVPDEPVPKVIDFGIAKATGGALTEKTLFTEQGQLIGTPEYMSPEQADLAGKDVDTRTDVYALGVLLYELLTGALPFASDTLRSKGIDEIRRIIREDDPPRPSTRLGEGGDKLEAAAELRATSASALRRKLAGDLDWIVLRALEKNRARRYESAAAFGDDIRRYLANEAVVARPQTGIYRLRKLVARHKLPFAFAAGTMILLLGVAVSMSVLFARTLRAERVARVERDAAHEVTNFVTDLFHVSNPGEAMGNSITAREILDQGAVRIESELADRPEIRATMLNTIGDVYQALGLYKQARPLLEEALAIREGLPDSNPIDVAESCYQVGTLHANAGRFAEAAALLARSLAIRERELDPDDLAIAQTLHALGMLQSQQGKLSEAEPFVRRALAIAENADDGESERFAEYLDAMAVLAARQGRIDEADPLFHQALEVRRTVLGPDHPGTALSWSNLGMLYRVQGKPDDAIPAFKRSLAIREKVLGPDHVDVAASLNNLGLVENDQERYAVAESLHRRALAIREAALGLDHPYVGQSSVNIAFAVQRSGRVDEAVDTYKRAMEIYEESFGAGYPDIARIRNDIAFSYERAGRDEEALFWRISCVEAWEETEGPEGESVASSLLNLGRNHVRRGHPEEAVAAFGRALAIRVKLFGEDGEGVEDARQELVQVEGTMR